MHEREVERVFREVGPRIWRAVYGYVGGRKDLADDVVAEAFARAIHHADAIRRPDAWIYRTAFRLAGRELRRERSFAQGSDAADRSPDLDALHDVLVALRRLPPKQRMAATLHFVDDRSIDEIGRLMKIAPPTVRVHLHRARARLRELLGDPRDG